jgi:branched-chain amino acid transport system permease protein
VTYGSIFLIASIALNFEYGLTGIPNLGLYLSTAGGAYIAGTLPGRLLKAIYLPGTKLDYINNNSEIISIINLKLVEDPLTAFLIFILTLSAVLVIGAFLGFLSVFPTIRLKVIYLMMTLVSMGEAIMLIGNYYTPIAGGVMGILIPNLLIGWGKFSFILTIIISITVVLLMEMIVRSPFGRLIRAIREDEVAAESLGKDVKSVKMRVVILGSILSAIAGFLYALNSGAVIATSYDRTSWVFWPWLMMMVGGLGNNLGCVVGTFLIIIVRRMLIINKYLFESILPFRVIWFEPILLATFLLISMAFMPDGILPEKVAASHAGLNLKIFKNKEKKNRNTPYQNQ